MKQFFGLIYERIVYFNCSNWTSTTLVKCFCIIIQNCYSFSCIFSALRRGANCTTQCTSHASRVFCSPLGEINTPASVFPHGSTLQCISRAIVVLQTVYFLSRCFVIGQLHPSAAACRLMIGWYRCVASNWVPTFDRDWSTLKPEILAVIELASAKRVYRSVWEILLGDI